MRPITPGILSLVLAACSSNAPAPDSQAGAEMGQAEPAKAQEESGQVEEVDMRVVAEAQGKTEMVCRREKTIGSNVGRRVCRPKGAASATSEANTAVLRRVQDLSVDKLPDGAK